MVLQYILQQFCMPQNIPLPAVRSHIIDLTVSHFFSVCVSHLVGPVYIPPNNNLRKEIIRLHHNTKESGHPGQYKTAELILHS